MNPFAIKINKMKKLSLLSLLMLVSFFTIGQQSTLKKITERKMTKGTYTMVVEGYDWGAAVSKVILFNESSISNINKDNFTVLVERSTECMELKGAQAKGERSVVHAYVSDEKGNLLEEGNHTTLVLSVGPNIPISSPLQYTRNDKCSGNKWVEYKILIVDKSSHQIWDKEANRIMPLLDEFDLTGSFTHHNLTMSYAHFTPKTKNKKSPLIIWLHGGGEGGTNSTIPLLANKAANYASPERQDYFGGAYVLAPQCPTAWMRTSEGVITRGKVDDMHNQGLMALIKDFVAKHPDIDTDRIYVGGCSNGGYMSLKLILLYPEYFAAGYISALAYHSEFVSDDQINAIKNVPIWFIHSKDDGVTKPEKTVVPIYQRLKKAGATNVHFSYYDHVVDLSGFYGGDQYHFNGHWSWIYSHVNDSKLDYDGKPVMLDNRPVTVMEWMAAQKK